MREVYSLVRQDLSFFFGAAEFTRCCVSTMPWDSRVASVLEQENRATADRKGGIVVVRSGRRLPRQAEWRLPMKRFVLAAIVLLFASSLGFAQQNLADSPATKEDIQGYFEVMHSREMMTKMMDAMTKPMHQMIHEQYEKDKDKLPADFEARMNKRIDDYLKDFPWDEVLQSMVPVYQKHLTKGDVDHLVAFYSSPTGQKLLREMPAIAAEAMQAAMPIMKQWIDTMTQNVQQQVAELIKQSETKPGQSPPSSNN
ncbi:MAG: DUF2059 domain-containing protein [Candidatus Acidiferrum sp.]